VRHQVCVLVTCAGVLGAAHTAAAQSPWYITGSAGAVLRFDASRSTTFSNHFGTTAPGTNTATYNAGPVVNLGVGYQLPLGFRIEGELGYEHYTTGSVSPAVTNGALPLLNGSRLTLQSGGGHNTYTGTINGFYDLPIPGQIVPYVGAGFGVEHTNQQTGYFAGAYGVPRFTMGSSNTTNAVLLGEVGVTFKFNANWSVSPSYRFEHIFTTDNAFPNNANIFKLGVRYTF
jgi:opacity protein-like surface antigen